MKNLSRSYGFSLIEVLVAWLILMTVLLGLLRLQVLALQSAYHNFWQTMAVTQLSNLIERLHANQTDGFRQRELMLWNQQNQKLLPRSRGDLRCHAKICRIELQWKIKKSQKIKVTLVSV